MKLTESFEQLSAMISNFIPKQVWHGYYAFSLVLTLESISAEDVQIYRPQFTEAIAQGSHSKEVNELNDRAKSGQDSFPGRETCKLISKGPSLAGAVVTIKGYATLAKGFIVGCYISVHITGPSFTLSSIPKGTYSLTVASNDSILYKGGLWVLGTDSEVPITIEPERKIEGQIQGLPTWGIDRPLAHCGPIYASINADGRFSFTTHASNLEPLELIIKSPNLYKDISDVNVLRSSYTFLGPDFSKLELPLLSQSINCKGIIKFSDAKVQAEMAAIIPQLSFIAKGKEVSSIFSPDGEGNFVICGLNPGSCEISIIQTPGSVPVTLKTQSIDIAADRVREVQLNLSIAE